MRCLCPTQSRKCLGRGICIELTDWHFSDRLSGFHSAVLRPLNIESRLHDKQSWSRESGRKSFLYVLIYLFVLISRKAFHTAKTPHPSGLRCDSTEEFQVFISDFELTRQIMILLKRSSIVLSTIWNEEHNINYKRESDFSTFTMVIRMRDICKSLL